MWATEQRDKTLELESTLDNAIAMHRVLQGLANTEQATDENRPQATGRIFTPREAVKAFLYRRLWQSVMACQNKDADHTVQSVDASIVHDALPLGTKITYRKHAFYLATGHSGEECLHVIGPLA